MQNGPGARPSYFTIGNVFLSRGAKRLGRGVNHPSPSNAEVKERIELYFYSLSEPKWIVLGRNFVLYLFFKFSHNFATNIKCSDSLTGCELCDQGFLTRFPSGLEYLSPPQSVRTGCGSNQHYVYRQHISGFKVIRAWICTSSPHPH